MNETPNMPQPSRDGCGVDVAAYALGALEPAEAEAFAIHLKTCAVCREELAEFASVVSALPMSTPQHAAPDRLRQRVLDTVREEAALRAPSSAHRASRARWNRLIVRRPALALGTAMAVLAIAVVGGLELGQSATPETHVYGAQVSGISGSAEVRVAGGHAELVVRHLSPPPQGKIYEVWLARPHRPLQPTSALFSVTSSGNGEVVVPGGLRGVTGVMVTPEPAGGSRVPTHAPVIRAQLT